MAEGRRVVLGVTGGVAAYKSAFLARVLMERDCDVRVVMTRSAQEFVGHATFAAITGTEPVTSLFDADEISPHTVLGQWADAIVIAPATASSISKLAAGQSSDPLIATVLASRAPVIVAPAMHSEMWRHPATERNIAVLHSYGYTVVDPDVGPLAGGDVGIGRLADLDVIADAVLGTVTNLDMVGLEVLVTAGGTREPLDPVRYIGNRSSGKMGNAIAEAAVGRGANVVLVTAAAPPRASGIETVFVDTADEMAEAVWKRASAADVVVMAAAVADFKPRDANRTKLRRAGGVPDIDLVPTPDILKGVHESSPRPLVVGFAAETGSMDAAVEKARTKGVDLLVANDVMKEGSGFDSDTNEVRLVFRDGTTEDLALLAKSDVAAQIWDAVLKIREES